MNIEAVYTYLVRVDTPILQKEALIIGVGSSATFNSSSNNGPQTSSGSGKISRTQ
jgi:hypothetical protein